MNEGQDKEVRVHAHLPNEGGVTRPLLFAFAMTCSFAVFELIGGWLSGSLALLSDSGHMFTDALALALSLGASLIATKEPTEKQTFGFFRVEIVVALLNGIVLVVMSGFILYEAYLRYQAPHDIEAPLMLMVALVGLGANVFGFFVLRGHAHENLNVRGAFLHVLGDLLSSIGVIVAAVLIFFYDLKVADPLISIMIAVVIMWGAFGVIRQSLDVLLEFAPSHIRAEDVRQEMLRLKGVREVHDIHMWTLSSNIYSISIHVVVEDQLVSACSCIIEEIEEVLKNKFKFSHVTVQLEASACKVDNCYFKKNNNKHAGK
ncbi:MAG: cation transporter [Methanomassiliicoccales archaeon]|nr:MAG: cation transporter [Methanomassiliicoccales archaeon]